MKVFNLFPLHLKVGLFLGFKFPDFNIKASEKWIGNGFFRLVRINAIYSGVIRTLILSTIFLLFSSKSFSQAKTESLNYEIVVLGIKIGTMTAQKVSAQDSLHYKVDSQVKFWFFGSVELKFNT